MSDGKRGRYDVGGTDDEIGSSNTDDLERDDRDGDRDRSETTSTSSRSSRNDSSRTREADQSDGIPHRVRYDSPKEARSTKTIALDDSDLERLNELQSLADQTFSETVYQMDVYLAALRAGLYSGDEAFLEGMREIGYGYFD